MTDAQKIDMLIDQTHRLEAKVDQMHSHLFIGNGNPAMTTRIAKIEQIIGGVVWLAGAALTAAVGLIVERVFRR